MSETTFGPLVDLTDPPGVDPRRVLDAPFRWMADHLPIGVFVIDSSRQVVYANRTLVTLTGGDPEHPDPPLGLDAVHPDDRDAVVAAARRARQRGGSQLIDCRLLSSTGATHLVRCRLAPLPGDDGAPVGIVGTVADHSAIERELAHRVTHDELTDLPNRALLAAQLEAALGRAAFHGVDVGVLFVGLQRLAVVTDALGHAAGDRLLRQAARRLVDLVGPGALVSRFAEDRFVIVLDELVHPTTAADLGTAVVAAMAEPFLLGPDEAFVAAAVGIAVAAGGASTVDQLVSDADVAMARAVAAGQGLEVFDAEMRAEVEARRTLELSLRRGMERGQFGLAYQPIVDLADGRVVGVEALARWTGGDAPAMGPDQFIPVAEDAGLIVSLGRDLLTQACWHLARWQRDRPDVFVSVNLSARQLAEPDLVTDVIAALRAAGAQAEGLHLEITETVLLDDVDAAVATLQSLKEIGLRLCLDDFGTGYSSLTYLCRLPVDVVKIDRSFVAGLGTSARDSSVVAAIVGMAGTLGHDLVAEGVETVEQAEHLRALGCGMAQGFLYSRPVGAEAIDVLLGP